LAIVLVGYYYLFDFSLAYAGIDPLGWVVSTKEWTDPSKAMAPTGKVYQSVKGEITKIDGNKITIKNLMGRGSYHCR